MRSRKTAFIPLLLVLVTLGACQAPRFEARVTQFHDIPPAAPQQSFVLLPHDEAKADSLEFRAYANRVVNGLAAKGYVQADSIEAAELVVFLDYSVGQGRVESHPVPVYGHFPERTTIVHGTSRSGKRVSRVVHETGGFEPLGFTDVLETKFKHRLDLDMVEAEPWRKGRTIKTYEGRVETLGRDDNLALTVPQMVEALFTAFPGAGDSTQTVILEPGPEG